MQEVTLRGRGMLSDQPRRLENGSFRKSVPHRHGKCTATVHKHLLKIQSPSPVPVLKKNGLRGDRNHKVLAWWLEKTTRDTQKGVRSKRGLSWA